MEAHLPHKQARAVRLVTPTSPLRLLLPWVLLGVVLAITWYFRDLVTLLMVAAAMAYVVVPVVDRLERARIPRSLAIVIVLLGIAGAMTLAVMLVLPGMMDQMTGLAAKIPAQVQNNLIPWANRLLLKLRHRLHLRIPTTVDAWLAQLGVRSSEIAQRTTGLALHAAGAGISVLEWIAESVIVLALAFYLLADWHRMIEGARSLVPRRALAETNRIATRVNTTLGRYVRGQLLVMAILGSLFAAGLMALEVPGGVGVGVIAGLLSFVPYAGFFVALAIAVALAMIDGGSSHVMAVFSFMWLVHFIDITLVTPRILGGRIGIPPAGVILALLAGGKVAGFIGLLAALPVATVLRVLLGELVGWYQRTRYFTSMPLASADITAMASVSAAPEASPHPEAIARDPQHVATRTVTDGTPLISAHPDDTEHE